MLFLWQGIGYNRILTVPNRCSTVAQSMSATCCCSQSAPRQISTWSTSADAVEDVRRVHLSQTIVWSMSVTWCHSQSVFRPNCCLIHVSRMMLFAECVLAKLLPEPGQSHDVVRRVCLSQTIARSRSVVWCCSQSVSQPNRCPIHVSRMMSLAECISAKPLPDLRQLHSVIHVACVVVWKVCPINMRMRRMREAVKSKQSHLYNWIWLVKDISYSMSTKCAQRTWLVRRVQMIIICVYDHDSSAIGLFLGTDGGRSLCSMADSGSLSVINRSATDCIGAIDLASSEI